MKEYNKAPRPEAATKALAGGVTWGQSATSSAAV